MRILNTHYEDVPPENSLTPEEVEQICCERVPVDECSEVGRVSDYNGASQDDIDQDALLEQARADNPGKRILGVRIEDIGRPGKPCGKMRETWQGHLNCCDFVEPMSWDTDTSVDVLAPNTRGIVGVNGGAPPFYWSVRGQGFALNATGNLRDGFTDTPYVWIYALHNACGAGPIEVIDGCSVVKNAVRSTIGEWDLVGERHGRDLYLEQIPELYACVTNSYQNPTSTLSTIIKGQFMMSQDFDPTVITYFNYGSAVLCAQQDLTGAMAVDPFFGIFSWLAINYGYWIYDDMSQPGNHWRVFSAAGTFYFRKWIC